MKRTFFLSLFLIISLFSVQLYAQSGCPNADFSQGNFGNWVGYTGTFTSCCPTQGIVNGRHTIMTGGTDPVVGTALTMLPPGATRSARLGNSSVGAQAERLRYSLTVTPQNALFIYKYAVVLEDPGHSSSEQPKFNIRVLNQAGNLLDPVCGFYSVVASGSIPGFQSAPGSVRWKNWTTVGLNLTPYMGQNITVEYTTYDCAQSGHFGYAYLACACEPMQINVNFCQGNGTVVLTAPPGFTYSWSPGGSTAQSLTLVNPTVGATYNCTLTSANGCQVVLQAVLQPTILTPAFNVTSPLCSNTKNFQSTSTVNQGSIQSYLWTFGNGATSTQQNPTYTYSSPGTYTVTLTITASMGGCTSSTSQQVLVYIPPVASAGPDKSICGGLSTTLTATGGGTYHWSNNSNNQSITVSPASATTYTVTVTNSNGCTATDNAVVNINPSPTASAGPNKSICIGQNTTLAGSGGANYTWAPANTLSNANIAVPTASPTTTTTYTLTVTNTNGCSGTSSMVLTVNPLPNPSAGTNVSICRGNSTTLNATGGTSYVWAPASSLSNANIANPVASPTITTTYTVTVTNAGGCTATASKVVTVNTLPPANAGTDQIICLNQSVNLTAQGGTQYQWSNGSLTQSINVSPILSTIYLVTVSDGNGCSSTDNVNVTVNTLPPASAGSDQAICYGNTTSLNASGGTSYSWLPSSTLSSATLSNPVASPSTTTTYTVTATDNNGCSASDNMVLTIHPLPPASAGPDDAICLGHNTTLNASGGVSYVWAPGTGLSSTTIAGPVATPIQTTTYSVTVTDQNACSATDDMVLTVNGLPPASAGPDDAICLNNTTTLNASGGTGYVWAPQASLNNGNIAAPVASPTTTTTFSVTVTDNNGCSATDDMVLTVYLLPPANAGADTPVCYGNSAFLFGSGGTQYSWSPQSTLSAPSTSNPVASNLVSTLYTVTVTDQNGCSETDDVNINIFSLPPANAGVDTSICENDNAVLTATGGVSYVWDSGQNTQTITVAPVALTTYTVTVTDQNTCSETDDVIVAIYTPPPADAGSNASICDGYTTTLNATGGVAYLWSPPTGLSNIHIPNPVASPLVQTTYQVTVTDAHTCTATDDVVVSFYPSPTVSFVADTFQGCSPLLVNFTDLSYNSINVWAWEFGDPASGSMNTTVQQNPIHLYQLPGSYTVTLSATTTDGCQETLSINNMITVHPDPIAAFSAHPPVGSIEYPYITFTDESINAASWFWNFGDPGSHTNYSTIQNPTHKFSAEGNFNIVLTIESSYGCMDSTSGLIRILPEYSIYIPNAFTPNGDGINDFFKAYATNIDEFQMYIFDRWGEILFEADNITMGWDGLSPRTMQPMMQDVYVYKIRITDMFGEKHQYIGRVTLILSK